MEREPNREAENSPERTAAAAVSVLEERDAADPVISSRYSRAFKDFLSPKENWKDAKIIGQTSMDSARLGMAIALKAIWGILKFAKEAIERKGNVGFKRAYEIGEEIFDFSSKKEKK